MPEGDTGIWCDKNENYFQSYVCVCVNVSESLGKCAHIFLRCSVSVFMCSVSHATLPGVPQCA